MNNDFTDEKIDLKPSGKKVDLFYFTDPLCAHCWALDTVLTRFKWEYKEYINVITVMGAMTEDGNHYENLNGEEAKEQVTHWNQVGMFYRIPINGRIWMKDPITSSFPSSIAYLLIKEQDNDLASKFLRLVREGAFIFEKNIAKREVLETMIAGLDLNAKEILDISFSEEGKKLLIENLKPMADLGVNGFPTVVMVSDGHEGVKVIGSRTLGTYKKALINLIGDQASLHPAPLPSLAEYLERVPTVFFHEIEKMYDLKKTDVKSYISNNMEKGTFKIGAIVKHKFIQKKSQGFFLDFSQFILSKISAIGT